VFDQYSLPILKQTYAQLEAKRAARGVQKTVTAKLVVA
jgi:tRNA uridine 5-carbamoylmethylation protein Kti12